VADHPLTRKRAHTVAYAIKHSQPYDATEAARLLAFLSAEIVGREQTVRNAIALIQRGKYRAARELLLPIAGGGP
jgi:hypothetical protein